MNKKLSSLIIVTSIIALPIVSHASETEAFYQGKKAGKEAGFRQGFAAAIAASSLAMWAYISSTVEKGLFIPAKINPKRVPTGRYTWVETTREINDAISIRSGYLEPIYEIIWENNPLHDELQKASSGSYCINQPLCIKENMIQTIEQYTPFAITATCACIFAGAIAYLIYVNTQDANIECEHREQWRRESREIPNAH